MTYEEALELFGLDYDATHEEIKKRYKELSRKHHPDKKHGSEEDKQQANILQQKINDGRDVLLNPSWSHSDSDGDEESEAKSGPTAWRDGDPKTQEELYQWLTEDSKKYDVDLAGDFAQAASFNSNIYANMWKLISGQRLTYYDLQCMAREHRKLFIEIVLQRNEMTEQVINGISYSSLALQPFTVTELLKADNFFHNELERLQNTLKEKFTAAESLFLKILMRYWEYEQPSEQGSTLNDWSKKQYRFPNYPLLGDSNRELVKSIEVLGVLKELACSIATLVRSYCNNTSTLSLAELHQQLKLRIDSIGLSTRNGFLELYTFVDVVQGLLHRLGGMADEASLQGLHKPQVKPNAVSEARAKELKDLIKKFKDLALDQAKHRLNNPIKIFSRQDDLKCTNERIVLYEKAVSIISEALPSQAVHRQPALAAVRYVVCWALSVLSFGVALALSDWVRQGYERKTRSHVKLTEAMQYFKKLSCDERNNKLKIQACIKKESSSKEADAHPHQTPAMAA